MLFALTCRNSATTCSLMEKMVISSIVMMRSCTGLVLPRTAPKEIRTVAVLKSALIILQEREETNRFSKQEWRNTNHQNELAQFALKRTCKSDLKKHMQRRTSYLKMLILIFPSSRCHMPCMRRPHCRPKAARSKLMPTLLNPYLLRKVIRKPKPMKIMTWTS